MEKLTIRGAADRTGLSVTTLRRYIRSGRLPAEKTPGRYGPEYTLSPLALEQAGVKMLRAAREDPDDGANGDPGVNTSLARALSPERAVSRSASSLPEALLRELVPIDLFRELSMKHEQLLVQYGMVRVGGQRMMEYKLEAERLQEALSHAEESAKSERERYGREVGFLKKHLRQAELEVEERNQEIASLRERIQILELVSRNAITTESLEQQFLQLFDKRLELEELTAASSSEKRRKVAALDEMLRSGFRARPPEEPTDQ